MEDKPSEDNTEIKPFEDNVSTKDSTVDILPPKSTSIVVGDICQVFGVFFAIGVRLILFTFCIFTVWLVVHRLEEPNFWALLLLTILMILEGINIVVTRAGQERKWVCICFICYIISSAPSIWILELDRLNTFQSKTDNTTTVSVAVNGLTAEVKLDPSLTLLIVEQGLLFLLILCRWLLPRGEITRNQLSQLLFVFIGMASDVMELFVLFDESDVREDLNLTIVILFVWTLSLFQFSLVLTMSRSPKKKRVALALNEDPSAMPPEDLGIIAAMLKTELWSLFISICMQDGPFLTVRLYTLITYNLINYSIIFFTCKNILVIMLLLYRLLVLLLEKIEEKDHDDDDDNEARSMKAGTTSPRRGAQVQPVT